MTDDTAADRETAARAALAGHKKTCPWCAANATVPRTATCAELAELRAAWRKTLREAGLTAADPAR